MKNNKILYFDCPSGISGDMALSSLFNLGIESEKIFNSLKNLNEGKFDIKIKKVKRSGISGFFLDLKIIEDRERSYREIVEVVENSSLPSKVIKNSLIAFKNLALAEAEIHGVPLEKVHFHEIGCIDTIIDIVGVMLCMEELLWPECFVSPLPLARGFVESAHGRYPLPAPATIKILEGFDVEPSSLDFEIVTPTGATIVKTLCKNSSLIPAMKIISTGYGFGKMEFKNNVNALRTILGERILREEENEEVVIEFSVDDMNPQLFSHFSEKIISKGAKDVFFTPVIMKKQRHGINVTIICERKKIYEISEVIFNETTTIGLRHFPIERIKLPYKIEKFNSSLGSLNVKIAYFNDEIKNISFEYEDLLKLVKKNKMPLKKLREIISSEFFNYLKKEKKMKKIIIFLIFFISKILGAESLSPTEIVEKAINVQNYGLERGSAKIKVEIVDDLGVKRERIIYSITSKEGGGRKTKILFLEPSDVRGTTLLILEEKERTIHYLYLPEIKKVRQIAGREKESSFMGSDLTYADLESKDIKDAKYERLNDEVIGGRECYKIKAIPEGETLYKYLEVFIDKKTFLILNVKFYDKSGSLLKTFFVRQVKKQKRDYVVTKAEIVNEKKKTRTRIEVLNFNLEDSAPSSVFEPSNLGK